MQSKISIKTDYPMHPASANFTAFITTRRNEMLDLIANISIFPTYLICIEDVISHILDMFVQSYHSLWYSMALLIALMPILSISGLNTHWRLGIKGRKRLFAVSVGIFLFFIFSSTERYRIIILFFLTFLGLLFEFLLRRMIARGKNKLLRVNLRVLGLGIAGIVVGLLWISLGLLLLMYKQNPGSDIMLPIYIILRNSILILLFMISPIVIYFGAKESWASFTDGMIDLQNTATYLRISVRYFLHLVFLGFILVAVLAILYTLNVAYKSHLDPYSPILVSAFSLTLLLLVAGPSEMFSRQIANFRSILRPLRANAIYSLISPSIWRARPWTLALRKVALFTQQNLSWIMLVLIWVIAGLVIPYYLSEYRKIEITEAASLGIISSIILSTFAFMVWLLMIRPKHIVIPFVLVGEKDPELEALTNLITQSFVERIRHIYLLLNMKQVENLSLRNDGGLAFFVTSGGDQEFVEQIRALGNIEMAQVKVPFSGFLLPLITELAATRIRGTVQHQADGSIVIWLEYIERGGRTVAVDIATLQKNYDGEIGDKEITSLADTLAVKLVHKLGHHAHLASSWQSLQLFLAGLNATYTRNWWRAISYFRQVVEIEDSARSGFGYGYYHLGAILMFQGEIGKGMEYLYHAEKVGPPLSETQYMLALGKFSLYRDYLHTERIQFEDIKGRCKASISLRPDFPEAHHLLGLIYYQRGRLRERALTYKYKESNASLNIIEPNPQEFVADYIYARKCFLRAIKRYDIALKHLPKDVLAQSTVFDERTRMVQDRMAATHRLGDTLRSLARYSEAASYYQEVLVAYPRNNRTLVDIVKTLTMAKTWQKAFEFLATEVLIYDELAWNKSVNFYRGWSLLGGLAETNDWMVKRLDGMIRLYELFFNWKEIITHQDKSNNFFANLLAQIMMIPHFIWGHQIKKQQIDRASLFSTAMDCLDFAYHQYPGYLYRWRQLDWFSELNMASKEIKMSDITIATAEQAYTSKLAKDNYHIIQFRLWLAWRSYANIYEDDKLTAFSEDIAGINNISLGTVYPYGEGFEKTFNILKEIRKDYQDILNEDYEKSSIKYLLRRKKCLDLAIIGNCRWEESSKKIEEVLNKNTDGNEITFGERWAFDVYVELSLFLIKLLVESRGYEIAGKIAKDTTKYLVIFRGQLSKACQNCVIVPLGNKVSEYQLATLYTWHAYTIYMQMQDVPTQARLLLKEPGGKNIDAALINEGQELIAESTKLVRFHPLTIYTSCLFEKKTGLNWQAADKLSRLISLVAPFDPHRFVSSGRLSASADLSEVHNFKSIGDLPNSLYQRERVAGRKQFDLVVNLYQIHIALADNFTLLGEVNLALEHIMHAISKSSYNDLTARLFLNLANALNRQGKFDDALSALVEAKILHLYLSPFEGKNARCNEPFVLECVLMSNLGQFPTSLEKANRIGEVLNPEIYISVYHEGLIKEIKGTYINGDPDAQDTLRDLMNIHLENIGRASSDEIVKLAAASLIPDALNEQLKNVYKDTKEHSPYNIILESQIISLLAKDLFNSLIYWCDIQNNTAFNLAELNYLQDDAKKYAEKATKTMVKIFKNMPLITQLDGEDLPRYGKSNQKRLQNVIEPFMRYATSYEDRLANYYDTQAWVLFRNGTLKSLKTANILLSKNALEYGADLAVIYYHLAQISKRTLEIICLEQERDKRLNPKFILEVNSLVKSFDFYWQEARRLDSRQTLKPHLRQLQATINEVKQELKNDKIIWP